MRRLMGGTGRGLAWLLLLGPGSASGLLGGAAGELLSEVPGLVLTQLGMEKKGWREVRKKNLM